jgi:hypothetical protein
LIEALIESERRVEGHAGFARAKRWPGTMAIRIDGITADERKYADLVRGLLDTRTRA